MRIIFKNKQEFLNTLYGDEEDYSYLTESQIKGIIKDKLHSLDLIYNYLDESVYAGDEQYDLGDCANLVQLFENIEFEEKDIRQAYIDEVLKYQEILSLQISKEEHKWEDVLSEKEQVYDDINRDINNDFMYLDDESFKDYIIYLESLTGIQNTLGIKIEKGEKNNE